MASAFLSSILSKTSQVLGFVQRWATSPSSSSDPRSSALEDLKKLERMLKRILAVLHDAEEREIREEAAVKLWLEELRQVAYDADDVLDEYHYEELRAQVEGRASRKRKHVEGDDEEEVSGSLSTTVLIPYGMRDRIREIRERFDEISLDRECLRLREEDGERRVSGAAYPAPSSHMVDESGIYGREQDKDKVIDLLLPKGMANGFRVIPIVGKGGLGKTTIAQLVYNDSRVKQFFDLTGWVCVSDDFDVTGLTKDIIESISPIGATCSVTQLSKLQKTLNEKVKGKRVLLVLDDVWNEQPSLWKSLINPFVGAEIVGIIVTCRNDPVAEIMQTVRPYHPAYLSEEQSWLLFKHYAFGAGNCEEQPSWVDIGKQIVKKCSGLPLAVKTIGSLLRHMTNEASWVDVLESDLWEVDKNNETFTALRLSYNRMPAHLKPCFIYCSMFPKDYVFEKDVLVRLWMAQGYVTPQGRRRLEDTGDEYFNDLQRRSFFDSFDGGFKMHDIIHDLAKYIARNEWCTVDDEKLGGFPNKVRHLYLQDHGVKSLSSYNSRALRTLFTWDDWFGYPAAIEHPLLILPMTGSLRTLQSRWESVDELSGSISNLKHLRYLHVRSESIKRLPESVRCLYHLQTLVLDCGQLAELPNGLNNLINLRHLQLEKCGNQPYLPAGVKKLTNLQNLCGEFKVRGSKGQGGIGVLKNLVDLQGILCISGLRNLDKIEDARDASLKSKHRLEQLFLSWDDWLDAPEFSLHLTVSPKENMDIPSDEEMEAVSPEEKKDIPFDEKMDEAILEYLEPHTNLKTLCIEMYRGSKFPKWVGDPFSLALLERIFIFNCENVRSLLLHIHDSLEKLDTVTPKEPLSSMLRLVNISNCQQLTSIKGLHNLHSLTELDVHKCLQLQLISEEGLPLNLKYLRIVECQQLALLSGLQNLTSLIQLHIDQCPRLRIMAEGKLSRIPNRVDIKNCPGLIDWCQIQKINCIEVGSSYKMTVSNNWEIIKHEFDDFSSIGTDELQLLKGLHFHNSWDCFRDQSALITELTIWSCTSIPPVTQRDIMFLWRSRKQLQRLVIKDCPDIEFLPKELLLPTVRSLIIDNCENLRNLQLAQCNRDELEELQIMNCSRLTKVKGLSCLSSLKTLRIKGCPNLWLSQDDSLPFVPPCIEIVGVLLNEIYSPHLEEAENRETIDDGRQHSQS